MATPKRAAGLGRGLSALLDDARAPPDTPRMLPISDIVANARQPRRHFGVEALDELARSIAERGILQPILVRPLGDGRYEIIAGERRWRAAQAARLHELPVVIRDVDAGVALELAIVENVQRADLNAIEEGESYKRLVDEFGHTQAEVAALVGKSRSHVTNLMRLLDLPAFVRSLLIDGSITMGHARALVGGDDPAALAREVVARNLSVRQTETLASRKAPLAPAASVAQPAARDADIVALERRLSDALGLAVAIQHGDAAGRVIVDYAGLDQLDLICQRLSGGRV